MTARTIPVAGEAFLGDDPAVMKVLKVTFGDTNQDVTINDGDTTVALGRPLCSLPYGIHVYDIGWRVITAFNGGVDILLGHDCSSDCDAFATDADIGCTTLKAELVTSRGQAIVAAADSDAATVIATNAMGFTPARTQSRRNASRSASPIRSRRALSSSPFLFFTLPTATFASCALLSTRPR